MVVRMVLLVRFLAAGDGAGLMDEMDPSRQIVRCGFDVFNAVHINGLVDTDDVRDIFGHKRQIVGDHEDGDAFVELAKEVDSW